MFLVVRGLLAGLARVAPKKEKNANANARAPDRAPIMESNSFASMDSMGRARRRRSRADALLFALLSASTAALQCEPWCKQAACHELNGDPQHECGSCEPSTHACAPRSESPSQSSYPDPQLQSCAVLTAASFLAQTPLERAVTLQSPTVVTNLTADWPDHQAWFPLFTFDASHPDKPASHTRLQARNAMLRIYRERYGPPPPFDQRSARVRISLGLGAGSGVSFCRHGFSWLALLDGDKEWYFAPPTQRKPGDPQCEREWARQRPPDGATHRCWQAAQDVMIVPTAWWHATCNFGLDITFGFGGEDDCDVRACDDGPTSPICPPDLMLAAACHGEQGARHALLERQTRRDRLEQSILTVASVDSERIWAAAGLPDTSKAEL